MAVSGDPVVVGADGQLGVAAAGSSLSTNQLLEQQCVVQELKATSKRQAAAIERQAATIALQEGQIKALNASLKQQAEAIIAKLEATDRQQQKQIEALTSALQKVSAQLELSKPAPQTVENNQ